MKKTKLLVAALSTVVLAGGVITVSTITSGHHGFKVSGEAQPLVLDVVKNHKVNYTREGKVDTVVTSRGGLVTFTGDQDTNNTAFRKIYNTSAIGNISGFTIEAADNKLGQVNSNVFSFSYGYELDGEGNPIYVKENAELNECPGYDATTNILTYNFDKHSGGAAHPNYIKFTSPGWKELVTLKISYGDNAIAGDAACAPVTTPSVFNTKVTLDYVDEATTDVDLNLDGDPTISWRGDTAGFTSVLTNPLGKKPFKVTVAGKPVTLPAVESRVWKDSAKYLERDDAANTIALKADLTGKLTISLKVNPDLTAEFKKINVIDEGHKEYVIRGTKFKGDESGYGWGTDLLPTTADATSIVWKNLTCGQGTAFQPRDKAHANDSNYWYYTLNSTCDPMFEVSGKNIVYTGTDVADYDVTLNLETMLVDIQPSAVI